MANTKKSKNNGKKPVGFIDRVKAMLARRGYSLQQINAELAELHWQRTHPLQPDTLEMYQQEWQEWGAGTHARKQARLAA